MVDKTQEFPTENNQENESKELLTLKKMNFQEYKRHCQLQIISESSKVSLLTIGEQKLDDIHQGQLDKFHSSLDQALKLLVNSVKHLKKTSEHHLKEDYVNSASNVYARIEGILEEVAQFELLNEQCDLLVDEGDLTQIQRQKTDLPVQKQSLPLPFDDILMNLIEFIRLNAKRLVAKAVEASSPWAPNTLAILMIQASMPCIQSVKTVAVFVKQMSEKAAKQSSLDQRKKEAWRMQCLQSEHVKNVFQMWNSKYKALETNIHEHSDHSELDDGLTIDSKLKIVKGGKLTKLVEYSIRKSVNGYFVQM